MYSIPYGKQSVSEEDIQSVESILRSDFLTQGPMVAEFEKKFASYVGAKFAVAVTNGTAALHLSALALGVENTSRVITTPITFAASANCIRYCGGEVIFSDIDPLTATLDLEKLRSFLNNSPKGKYQGVVSVDFAGFPVDLEKLRKICDEFGMWIIEDAAHALGGYFVDSGGVKQMCGNGRYTDLAIFSFHPVKHMTTGEGGMITTNRKDLYDKLLILRTHGITKDPQQLLENHGGWYYEMQELGFNYRISDILCALGISQLNRVEVGIKRRREIADRYDHTFSNKMDLEVLSGSHQLNSSKGIGHAYHLYVIKTKKRKALYDYLRVHNIFSQVHYIPVHLMPYYQSFGCEKGMFPCAESYYEECLSLPMFASLSINEQEFVITTIKNFFKQTNTDI